MYTELQNAVIQQLDIDPETEEGLGTLEDIANHGIDGGFHGFIYTRDTVEFYDKNRAVILAEVNQMADDMGTDPISMIQDFGCIDSDDPVAEVVMGISDDTTVKNALAWFAAEQVAYQLTGK